MIPKITSTSAGRGPPFACRFTGEHFSFRLDCTTGVEGESLRTESVWAPIEACAIIASDVSKTDHHSAYLAKAIGALTPRAQAGGRAPGSARRGRRRSRRGRELRRRSKAEVDVGLRTLQPASVRDALSRQELNVLIPGFRTIRDQEPLDDVADWANAVVAARRRSRAQLRGLTCALAARATTAFPECSRQFAWRMLANAI